MPSITQKLDELIKKIGGPASGNGLPIDKKLEQLEKALDDISTDIYHFKGSVADEEHLPTSGQEVGDVYNIIAESSYGGAGANVAWTGTEWDALGGSGGGAGGGGLVEITWSELKSLRDNGELVPGTQYRITDYICTVANDENAMVESHPYDIIVTADSESVLNENARAALKANDNYYNVEGQTDAVLENWELKYCLDNDASRFQWADAENGKGVVYYLKDDRNNECWYDFKQIKFKRYQITEFTKCPSLVGFYADNDAAVPGMILNREEAYWFFTFSYVDENAILDISIYSNFLVRDNKIGAVADHSNAYLMLPRNVLFGSVCFSITFGDECKYNTFGNACHNNTFGNACSSNTFGVACSSNTFGNAFSSNTFGYNCSSNTIGNNCSSNTLGNNCSSNAFGNNCQSNSLGNTCQHNTFGDAFQFNSLGNNCSSNTFGDVCQSNSLGNNCSSNTLGDACQYNTFGDAFQFNSLGNNCSYNSLSKTGSGNSNKIQYYHVLSGASGKASTPLDHSSHISFNNKFTTYVGYNSSGVLKYYCPMDSAT